MKKLKTWQIILLVVIYPLGLIYLSYWLFVFVYEHFYYKSEKFKALKSHLHRYTLECNELNHHIEELKHAYSGIRKTNYGQASLNDNSKFSFKRKQQVSARPSEYIYECSAGVCKNAETQPFKYLCKYFNITSDESTLERFENILNSFSAAEEGKVLLHKQLQELLTTIQNEIPFFIRKFRLQKFTQKLGFHEVDFSTLYFPVYSFRYISSGGNKSTRCDITLDIENLNHFVQYLSELVKYRKSVAGQRALMTSKLRESIKRRDNYTCRYCGVSTYTEPHLLLEIDHVIPLAKGGLSDVNNLQTLCWKCNRKKGSN